LEKIKLNLLRPETDMCVI